MATVHSVCISEKKGVGKETVNRIELREGWGVVDDAHGGSERQVSLLAVEAIEDFAKKLEGIGPGDFAENITMQGVELEKLGIGSTLQFAGGPVLEITQIGKKCHNKCAIFHKVGNCIMPKLGVFARVVTGGKISPGDTVDISQAA